MKILVIEDDAKPDYKDIERCLKKCIPTLDIKRDITHLTSFSDGAESIEKNGWILCVTDILEHEGQIDFESVEFDTAFNKGIQTISMLYQRLDCYFMIITKIPVNVLRTQFDKLKDDSALNALFGERLNSLHDDLIEARGAMFTIYNKGNIHIVAKPYDQYGNKRAEVDWWLGEFNDVVSGLSI